MTETKEKSEKVVIKDTLMRQLTIKRKILALISADSTKTNNFKGLQTPLAKEEEMAEESITLALIALFAGMAITLITFSYFTYIAVAIILILAFMAFLKGNRALKYDLSGKFMKYAKIGKKLGLTIFITLLTLLSAFLYLLYLLRDWDLTFGS